MDQEELFRRLAVALAIGVLIGLERGWQTRDESDHQRTAGLRTFALTGLLGGICGLVSIVSSPFVLAAGLLAFTGALVTFSFLEATAEKNFSVTGVVAGMLTFLLGAYATPHPRAGLRQINCAFATSEVPIGSNAAEQPLLRIVGRHKKEHHEFHEQAQSRAYERGRERTCRSGRTSWSWSCL